LTNGPNGHALQTSTIDAISLPESLIQELKILGGDKLWLTVRALRVPIIGKFFSNLIQYSEDKKLFRRLCAFPDKEGKMRVIGILDYFSQIALRPLHLYLSRVLKRIPQDCTLDQTKFKDLILGKGTYYSVDLSAATDRFPISVIKSLLSSQLPEEYVDA